MPNDDIMTVKELADYLKIAEKTTYRFASEGRLPGFKVRGAWRFRKSEIDRRISEQEQKGEDKNDGN
ncbi:MAG: helix-turn-helix domain-containing protein [Pseudomonadota bacterium]